jgi:hypothetical protein
MVTLVYVLLLEVQVIAGGQINNKVFGETHLFSTYPLEGASQAMISYVFKYV